jgi:hypothetical protein
MAVVKTVMSCIGCLHAEQEQQANEKECSHGRPVNFEIRLLSPGYYLLFPAKHGEGNDALAAAG